MKDEYGTSQKIDHTQRWQQCLEGKYSYLHGKRWGLVNEPVFVTVVSIMCKQLSYKCQAGLLWNWHVSYWLNGKRFREHSAQSFRINSLQVLTLLIHRKIDWYVRFSCHSNWVGDWIVYRSCLSISHSITFHRNKTEPQGIELWITKLCP